MGLVAHCVLVIAAIRQFRIESLYLGKTFSVAIVKLPLLIFGTRCKQ